MYYLGEKSICVNFWNFLPPLLLELRKLNEIMGRHRQTSTWNCGTQQEGKNTQ